MLQTLSRQSDAKSVAASAQLEIWRSRADAVPLDQFFAMALGADGLRRKFIARFGSEVEDILDAFLMEAQNAAREDNPGLDAFIEALNAAPPEIKRQMDQSRNEVRILTVHGAKGLEAPHVFLVDGGGAISSTWLRMDRVGARRSRSMALAMVCCRIFWRTRSAS